MHPRDTIPSDLDELIRREEEAEEECQLLKENDLFGETLIEGIIMAMDMHLLP